MSTQELKDKLAGILPEASKIKVRQYPMTYKGSMRGYTTVTVQSPYDFYTVRDKVMANVPDPKHTFVDNY